MSFGGFGGPVISPLAPQPNGRYDYGPDRYALPNLVDLYTRIPTQDKDRATIPTCTLFASQVPCSVQAHSVVTRYDENTQAIIQFIPYSIFFASNPGLKQYDQIWWLDTLGNVHKILVIGTRDEAGRGASFVIDAEERI